MSTKWTFLHVVLCHYCMKIFNRLCYETGDEYFIMELRADDGQQRRSRTQGRDRRRGNRQLRPTIGDCCASGRYRCERMDDQGTERDGAV